MEGTLYTARFMAGGKRHTFTCRGKDEEDFRQFVTRRAMLSIGDCVILSVEEVVPVLEWWEDGYEASEYDWSK